MIRTNSGVIYNEDFSAPVSADFTVVGNAPVIAGGECSWAAGSPGYLVSTNALPALADHVIRSKSKGPAGAAAYYAIAHVEDAAARPNAFYASIWDTVNPGWTWFPQAGGGEWFQWDPPNTFVLNAPHGAPNTYFIHDIEYDAGNTIGHRRDATTFAIIEGPGSQAYAYTNDRWLIFGNQGTGDPNLTITLDYIQVLESFDISVTNLNAGNAVRLLDAGDNPVANAVEAGGTATMDCVAVGDFPFTGYVVAYEDNTWAVEIDRYPDAGNASDIYGGDTYQREDPSPPSPPLPPGSHYALGDVSDPSSGILADYPPHSGRIICEDGTVRNIIGGFVDTGLTRDPDPPKSGRFICEDNTVVNIADLANRRSR